MHKNGKEQFCAIRGKLLIKRELLCGVAGFAQSVCSAAKCRERDEVRIAA